MRSTFFPTVIMTAILLFIFLFASELVAEEIETTKSAVAKNKEITNNRIAEKNDDLEIIEVTTNRNQVNSEMSQETEQLMSVAGIGNDPLNAIYSLPGIVYGSGARVSPAVRGSSPDDNAFYIDDMPAGYIFHLFGDSIFNENLIQDFSLHPAAFGSEYGNATGGIFDVKLRDPRHDDITTTIDLSMLKSSLMVEGQTLEEQAFYLSYRKSQIHLFLSDGTETDGYTIFKPPVSEDYQGKYQWLIGDSHKLTLSASGASDAGGINISENSEAGRIDPDNIGDLTVDTKFDSQNLTWQYYGDEDQVMKLVAGHTVNAINQNFGKGQFIKVDDELFHTRFSSQFPVSDNHKVAFGIDYSKVYVDYSFDLIPYYCTENDADCNVFKGDRVQDTSKLNDETTALYLHDIWKINNAWELTSGFRAEKNNYTDQSFFHPRFNLNWFATNKLTVKAKAGSYSRFPDVEIVLDKLGNPEIKSPESIHYSLGIDYALNNIWFTSIDIYHKELTKLPRSIDENSPVEDIDLHYTNDISGDAQGIEWLVKHERNKGLFGWASLSWSQSQRTDDLTNTTTDYYLDTPLVANVVVNYILSKRWDFGLRFTLRSGAKYTPIVGLYENPDYSDKFLPSYGELNSQTLPVYHRLDLEANYQTTYWGYDAEWTMAVINAMNHKNVSGYYYLPTDNDTPTDYNVSGEEDIGIFPYLGLKMVF